MAHKHGTHLDGMASMRDLRGRCVIDQDTGCWHVRTARGRPYPHAGSVQVVWVHGRGPMTALRAAWLFTHGPDALDQLKEQRRIVYRCCASHDCVCPRHLAAGTWKEAMAVKRPLGVVLTPRHLQAARENGHRNAKISPEMRVWAIESRQSAVEAGHGLGICRSRVAKLRTDAHRRAAERGPASVFALGVAMGRGVAA